MRKISIVIPTYNESANVPLIAARIKNLFDTVLENYLYEIIFIDNHSTDDTREKIENLCAGDADIKAIFNAKNFGFSKSTFYGLCQGTGDCTVLLFADMQDPPETIVQFIREWESGYKIVVGIKNKSRENPLVYSVRKIYYKFIKKIGEIEHIEQFTGFGLYDAAFINVIRNLEDPLPYLRGIVAELGYQHQTVYYEQQKRQYGKSSFNFMKLYDTAMLGITSYTKSLVRIATILGFGIAFVSVCIALVTFILKLTGVVTFDIGIAAISVGVYLFGALTLFFIGLIGEYIINMNIRIMKHPLVVEEKRINF